MSVERYFFAQFAYTLVTQIAIQLIGTESPYYGAIYSVFTALIICTMFSIISGDMKHWILSWMAGVIVAWICFVALPRPLKYYNWISLAEGMTLTACGCLMIYHAKNSLYLSLGILWLALPAYRLCYALEPSWKSLNGWLPAAMCVCCFTFIGYSSRRPSRVR